MLLRTGDELREARLAGGLTLRSVADTVGSSPSEISRIERGRAPWTSVTTLARVASVVGLDLWLRAYPGGDALRDATHARLEVAFHALCGPGLGVEMEVPVGDRRDLRAWDIRLTSQAGGTAGVEVDTRLTDAQAYLRRLALKRRDGPVDRVIVVLRDTRSNRVAVDSAGSMFASTFAIEDPQTRIDLAAGRIPGQDALLFVSLSGSTSRPATSTPRRRRRQR